jgi:hypothetical protein
MPYGTYLLTEKLTSSPVLYMYFSIFTSLFLQHNGYSSVNSSTKCHIDGFGRHDYKIFFVLGRSWTAAPVVVSGSCTPAISEHVIWTTHQ